MLEINTSMLFNLAFARNTILSYFFLFFLIIDFYFLTRAAISQIFNPNIELAILIVIPTKKDKADTETHQLTAETKTSECLTLLKTVQTFLWFLLIK